MSGQDGGGGERGTGGSSEQKQPRSTASREVLPDTSSLGAVSRASTKTQPPGTTAALPAPAAPSLGPPGNLKSRAVG